MKKIFYFAILGLIGFEIANVYFSMPMRGGRDMHSIGIAYFLHSWRWIFRIVFYLMIGFGFKQAFSSSKWLSIMGLLLAAGVTYAFNFEMKADHMFLQPKELIFKNAADNTIPKERLILGVTIDHEAKAYPISFIGYHHQVRDTLAGKEIMVTYCTVCRTGRVFEPIVDGKPEVFRLVGMDHFNAMFEDETTKSWWRQENGEAVAGKLKGKFLTELPSQQATLETWLKLYPNSLIMQADPHATESYDTLAKYELGKSKSKLTKRDSLSWKNKSWIIGIQSGTENIAIDWNDLQNEKLKQFELNGNQIILCLASDHKSFFAFENPSDAKFSISNDTLYSSGNTYNLKGENLNRPDSIPNLKSISAYQEYWHSWKTFHPHSKKHGKNEQQ
jgi:hypothetical protein